jgi:GNAT superfamily N-acetyltransferase
MNIATTKNPTAAINWLNQDLHKNIIILKYLQSYGQYAECWYSEHHDQRGVLMILPTRYSPFDYQLYPDADYLALPVFSDPQIGTDLIRHLPQGRIAWKMPSEYEHTIVQQYYPLTRTLAYLSYRIKPQQHFAPIADIVIREHADQACLDLYAQQGHDPDEVREMFEQGHAFSCSKYQGDKPVCSSYIHQNYQNIWEVGGLYTIPEARRQGFAKQVVQTALAEIQHRGLTARYVAHESNVASQQLARELGLEQFLTISHYLS